MIRVLYVGSGLCSCKGMAGELPEFLQNHAGVQVDVVVPHADGICEGASRLAERLADCTARIDGVDRHVRILEGRTDGHVRVFYMNDETLRGGLSLSDDNGVRACAVYAQAVCAWADRAAAAYDVIHCDGLETALVPVVMRRMMRGERMKNTKSVVFVKGIADKGGIDMSWISRAGLPHDLAGSEGMEFYGKLSVLKGAYLYADALAFPNGLVRAGIEQNRGRDIGMEGVLFGRTDRIHTISVGIDVKRNDPATDRALEASYSADDMAGKKRCKAALVQKHRLRKDRPLVSFVGALNADSGIELVNEILDDLMDRQVNLLIAGEGGDAYNRAVESWKNEFKGSVAWICGKPSKEEVRRIMSASDIVLIPSRNENICRLHQVAMRYGCVPVVRNAGAAANDVRGVRNLERIAAEENGFTFERYDSDDFFNAAMDALDIYESPLWGDVRSHAMQKNFCLAETANDCIRIYEALKD